MLGLKRRIRDSADGAPTYISPSTKIVGTMTGRGFYVCGGTIEGECDIEGTITIADGARWKGTLKATDVVIGGTIEGNVIAQQRIEVARSARITGSLAAKSIAVAEGAIIDGPINVTSGGAPVRFQEKRQP